MGNRHDTDPTADLATGQDRCALAAPPLVSSCQPSIAAVGGSLTGPVLALLLLQAGFERVAVYEAAPAAASLGGGLLSLEHSALDVLDRLDIPQHEYVKFGFETITQITAPGQDGPGQPGAPGIPGPVHDLDPAARRPDRPPPALRGAPQPTSHRTSETCGGPVLHFADGEREPVDLVAFADGRSSTGRRLLDPGRRLHYAGYVAHRGDTPTMPAELPDFRRLQPCPGVQFNIAPVPTGCDWTFYLNATAAAVRDPVRRPAPTAGLRPAAARQPGRARASRRVRRDTPARRLRRRGPRHADADGGTGDGHRPTDTDGVAAGRRRACGAARRRPGPGTATHRPRCQQRHRTGRRTGRRPAPAPPARRRPHRGTDRVATPAPAHRPRRGTTGPDHRWPTGPGHPSHQAAGTHPPTRPGQLTRPKAPGPLPDRSPRG